MDSNFHTRFEARVEELKGDDLIDYMFECIPFIQQYNGDGDECETAKGNGVARMKGGGIKKNDIFNEYLERVENVVVDKKGPRRFRESGESVFPCKLCDSSNVFSDNGWQETCGDCGACRENLTMELTYKEEQEHVDRNANYSYKRSNHFQEWLNQLQAAESTTIPPEVIDMLRGEFKKEKISNIGSITHSKVRAFLKKLKLNRYYEHVPYISNILSGVPPMRMPEVLQERLKHMFNEIQAPFDKHCPAERKNFLSYSYVLYKFCELLSEDEFLVYFPLLKSREKLAVQDSIWKNICKELRWEFIATV